MVESFFEEIRMRSSAGEMVKLSGLSAISSFARSRRRPGRNPKTGEEIPITGSAAS
jgi:integration host factor subunit alpha